MTQQQHTGFDARTFQGQTSSHITKHEPLSRLREDVTLTEQLYTYIIP